MRKSADLPRDLVAKRYAKEKKRELKREMLRKIPKVKGSLRAGGYIGMNRWTGLAPRKLEGYMLYVRGHKITEAIWKKVYGELPFGSRMRMV